MGGLFGLKTGPLSLLKTVTLGIDTASIALTGIPPGYNDLVLVASLRGTGVAPNINALLRFNGDAGANYDGQYVMGAAAVVSAAAAGAGTSVFAGMMTGSTALANSFGSLIGEILGYAMTDRNKEAIFDSHFRGDVTATQNRIAAAAHWLSTAAINQIELIPQTNLWKAGSFARLYGRA